jgi:lysyl-tRNA synthetase class 2
MKILLSKGADRIFELGSAFRSGEFGSRHREEFTILEYYAVNCDYRRLAEFTAELMAHLALELNGSTTLSYRGEKIDFASYEFITVDEAYRRWAGVSADEADRDGSFDELMVCRIEPNLGRGKLTFLIDYPASRASLARRKKSDPSRAERWEVYASGMELGNAFGELTDAVEQKMRFNQAAEFRKSQNMHRYPEASDFFDALDRGLPDSSGCALGFDRLAMVLFDIHDIGEVRV